MTTIVDDLLSNEPQKQADAFRGALALIHNNQWDADIGHGCNLFHFIAFVPQDSLEQALPDWKERLEAAIGTTGTIHFDKENNASAVQTIKGQLEGGDGIPAINRDTPLGIALYRGNGAVADVFLKNGADVYHKNGTGNTILHLAAASNTLVSEISQQVVLRAFEARTDRGQTPIDQARQHGHPQVAEALSDRCTQLQAVVARWVNDSGASRYR